MSLSGESSLDEIHDKVGNTEPRVSSAGSDILLCTGYSEDYTIGHLTSYVNQQYAQQHGYQYYEEVLSYEDMLRLISPCSHCTWYKVYLIRRLLEYQRGKRRTNEDSSSSFSDLKPFYYVLWLDADAMVIDPSICIEDILHRAEYKPLILAENMNSGFLINAGVLLISTSDWSFDLWNEVWNSTKYAQVLFYEQSALLQALKTRKEGLLQMNPFHSFMGGPEKKAFKHVFVLNHMDFNSNRGWIFPKQSLRNKIISDSLEDVSTNVKKEDGHYSVHEGEAEDDCARFIYHAAGVRNKMAALKGMLQLKGMIVPDENLTKVGNFRLFRSSTGGIASVVQ